MPNDAKPRAQFRWTAPRPFQSRVDDLKILVERVANESWQERCVPIEQIEKVDRFAVKRLSLFSRTGRNPINFVQRSSTIHVLTIRSMTNTQKGIISSYSPPTKS